MSWRAFIIGPLTFVCFAQIVLADHLPPVDPIRLYEDHVHENHAGHCEVSWNPEGSNLSFTNFSDAVFDYGTSLRSVDVTGAVFDRASLVAISAQQAIFQNSSFRDVNWPLAGIMDLTVRSTDFTGSNLSGSFIYDAAFDQVIMRDVDLSLADFRNVQLNATDLRGANLSGANLRNANLGNTIVDATTTFDGSTSNQELVDSKVSFHTFTRC